MCSLLTSPIIDTHGFYGGDESAMYLSLLPYYVLIKYCSRAYIRKVASHEMKGLLGFYGAEVKGLRLPLMVKRIFIYYCFSFLFV